MTERSPVVLFVFNRPKHAAATLDALAKNELADETDLYVFCDGPRSADDEEGVEKVRALVRDFSGFKTINVVERTENWGLARSIISGIEQVLAEHETIIVLEDDMVTSEYFLPFMNQGLAKYADDDRVCCVCGYAYPIPGPLPETFFLDGAHCWGWGTWRRGWSLFEPDPWALLERIDRRDLIWEYDLGGAAPHMGYLLDFAVGKSYIDSWAIRWIGAAFAERKLTLYPSSSLLMNIGQEGSGTHGVATDIYNTTLAVRPPRVGTIPVQPSALALTQIKTWYIKWRRTWSRKASLYYRVARFVPDRLERMLYTAFVRRSLRQVKRDGRWGVTPARS